MIYLGMGGADFDDDTNVIAVDWNKVAQDRYWKFGYRRLLPFHHSQHSFMLITC